VPTARAKVDVIVSATNQHLATLVREGRFRRDIYRLNVFPVRLPPLREGSGTSSRLPRAFLRRASRRLGRTGRHLAEARTRCRRIRQKATSAGFGA
jgi:transcriptional regulator with GAF, ATPase, and Fis domain